MEVQENLCWLPSQVLVELTLELVGHQKQSSYSKPRTRLCFVLLGRLVQPASPETSLPWFVRGVESVWPLVAFLSTWPDLRSFDEELAPL